MLRLTESLGEPETAQWAVYQQAGKKVLVTRKFTLLEPAGAPGYEPMATAASRAVGALSREIAEALRAEH